MIVVIVVVVGILAWREWGRGGGVSVCFRSL